MLYIITETFLMVVVGQAVLVGHQYVQLPQNLYLWILVLETFVLLIWLTQLFLYRGIQLFPLWLIHFNSIHYCSLLMFY